jgi:hypothetical protein
MGAGMSRWILALAAGAVRGWTWVYTLPLDSGTQYARRAEIASDLWEFQHDPTRGDGGVDSALHLLLRAALGVPDDLLWCCEQLPEHPRTIRPFAAVRFVVLITAASGLVVSASRPPLDVATMLRVRITSSGWVAVEDRRADAILVPAFAFTVSNVADRPTSALQVNAVFYGGAANNDAWGTTFVSVVGGRGLAAGATSRNIVVRAHGWNASDAAGVARRLEILHIVIPDSRVRLFGRHEGRWTLLADDPIRPQLMHP